LSYSKVAIAASSMSTVAEVDSPGSCSGKLPPSPPASLPLLMSLLQLLLGLAAPLASTWG
jgi:hypothetical protein